MSTRDLLFLKDLVENLTERVRKLEVRSEADKAASDEAAEIMAECKALLSEVRESGTLAPKKPAPKVKPGKRPELMKAAGVGKDPEPEKG